MVSSIDKVALKLAFSKAKITLMNTDNTVFICTILFSLLHSFDETVPTAETDGIFLKMNPDWFLNELSHEHRVALLAHEAWHVAFDHMTRGRIHEPQKYNLAADYVINIMLQDSGMTLPPGGYVDAAYRGMSTEEVYKLLPDTPPPPNTCGGGGTSMLGDIAAPPGTTKAKASQQAQIQEIILRASMQAEMSKEGAGSIPGEIARAIEEMKNPQLDWFTILMNFMTEFDKTDYSYRRPNRRFMPEHILPSLYGEGMGELALAFDASGSVSPQEFSAYYAETAYMRETVNPSLTTIIDFDTTIKNIHSLHRDDNMDGISFSGGGGTSLRPVFAHFKDRHPSVLIVFSDLECSPIEEDPGYPVIWIAVNARNPHVNFGKLIEMNIGN